MNIESLQDSISPYVELGEHTQWVVQVSIVILLTLTFSYIANRVIDRLHKKLQHTTANFWDDALAHAAQKPLRVAIWIVGIGFAADIIYKETEAAIFSGVQPIRDVGVVACMAWFFMRFIRFVDDNIVEAKQKQGKDIDKTTRDAVLNILKATVVITAILVSMQTLGFSVSGVLAFGGVGGIAIGFAAKDLLANFFGALLIFLDKPFRVGDWIRSPDQEIEGTVERIGWRQTVIRTFDKRPLYVPNSVFATIVVENPSRMTHRRIHETIGVRYADMVRVQAICDDVRQMLIEHKEIDETQTLMVQVNAFGPSSVDFFVYTFTHTVVWTEFHKVKQDVMLKIAEIIDAHGAEIAFPTQTLHVAELPTVGMEATIAQKKAMNLNAETKKSAAKKKSA